MSKTYFTLITWEDGAWHPQFGDYSKRIVRQEWKDSYRHLHCRIISSGDTQTEINSTIAKEPDLFK